MAVSTLRGESSITLKEVIYAPEYNTNVISLLRLLDHGYDIDFKWNIITLEVIGEVIITFVQQGII
jgi:hypothetical protein